MRRTFIMAAAIGLIASSAAFASDLGLRAPPPVPYAGYGWTGFYVGGHGGYGFGQTQDVTNAGAAQRDLTGGFGGIQGGYNWQRNGSPLVLGVEADVSFGKIGADWGGASQFDPYYGKDSISTFGTVRGRVGYAFDRVLVYGTGGLAWGVEDHGFGCDAARVTATTGCQNKAGGKAFFTNAGPTNIGWTVGGGLEYAVLGNWTAKVEYLYTDLGSNSVSMVDPNYPTAKSVRNFDTTFQTIKVGVNYRF